MGDGGRGRGDGGSFGLSGIGAEGEGSGLNALGVEGGDPRREGSLAWLIEAVSLLLAESRELQAESLEPKAEARDLVAAWFDQPRHWPDLNGSQPVSDADWEAVLHAARKRAAGAPVQYAVGKANFRHLTLAVDERVLIPRPETELLVDLVLQRAPRGGTAVDVGTGSGAIAIALAAEGKFDRVIAADLSSDALDVARANAERAGVRIEFVESDALRAFQVAGGKLQVGSTTAGDFPPETSNLQPETRFSVVVSNPPYITFDEARALPAAVRDWEPALALFSPRDGLSVTRRIVAQAAELLQDGGLLALEVDARRASLVAELVASDPAYENVSIQLDLTGRERFVLGIRRRRKRDD